MMNNAPFPDLCGEHRAEPVPPEPYRLVADIDTALEQQVLDLAQRQRVPDIHHHREANDFGRTIEIAEGIFHPLRLGSITRRLKPLYSDNAKYSTDYVDQENEAKDNRRGIWKGTFVPPWKWRRGSR